MCVAAALIDGILGAAIIAQVWPSLLRKVSFRHTLFNKVIFRKIIFRSRMVIFRIIMPKDLQESLFVLLILNVEVFDELRCLHQIGVIHLV